MAFIASFGRGASIGTRRDLSVNRQTKRNSRRQRDTRRAIDHLDRDPPCTSTRSGFVPTWRTRAERRCVADRHRVARVRVVRARRGRRASIVAGCRHVADPAWCREPELIRCLVHSTRERDRGPCERLDLPDSVTCLETTYRNGNNEPGGRRAPRRIGFYTGGTTRAAATAFVRRVVLDNFRASPLHEPPCTALAIARERQRHVACALSDQLGSRTRDEAHNHSDHHSARDGTSVMNGAAATTRAGLVADPDPRGPVANDTWHPGATGTSAGGLRI
jgi:hypothetical protein